jgi:serine/threonine-protein kinase RsbW
MAVRLTQPTTTCRHTVRAMTEPATLATRAKRRSFPGCPDQVAQARDFTRRTLGPCPVTEDAVLLVSELVTNALRHTATGLGGRFDVTILGDDSSVMIAVTDNGSDKVPVCGATGPEDMSGRGLELVESIADRWGHCGGRHGRTVWFELRWAPTSDHCVYRKADGGKVVWALLTPDP